MVKDTKLYNTLGVSPTAEREEILKAYRKLAFQVHPDKNPDDPEAAEKFKELGHAKDILSDQQKRRQYDEMGEEGLEQEGRGGAERGEDVGHHLGVTLEELYNGTTKELALRKTVLCSGCKGAGSKSGKSTNCGQCNGCGVQVLLRQLRPGLVQQLQVKCSKCRGEGICVDPNDVCPICSGDRILTERKVLQVFVEKGMQQGQRITFTGEGNQHPDIRYPGDVIMVLKQEPHRVFTRNGKDLLMKKTISLYEALLGCSFPVRHLDGRVLAVKSQPGQIIKPDSMLAIPNEGMPTHGNPYDKGQMLIQFEVEMPTTLSPSAMELLASALPAPNSMDEDFDPAQAEECFLHSACKSNPADGDGDEEEQQQGVQCVHQ